MRFKCRVPYGTEKEMVAAARKGMDEHTKRILCLNKLEKIAYFRGGIELSYTANRVTKKQWEAHFVPDN